MFNGGCCNFDVSRYRVSNLVRSECFILLLFCGKKIEFYDFYSLNYFSFNVANCAIYFRSYFKRILAGKVS